MYRGLARAPGGSQFTTATQFQLDAARSAFPCVDAPFFRANLSLALIHPPGTTALGSLAFALWTRTQGGLLKGTWARRPRSW